MARFSAAILFFLVFAYVPAHGANILFFVGITNYSHRMAMWPLVQTLADRGHSVTFLSAHPPGPLAHAKVTEVIPTSVVEMMKKFQDTDLLGRRLRNEDETVLWTDVAELSIMAYEALAEDEEFLKWFHDDSTNFDLVFIDAAYSEFAFGIAHKSGAKFAIISTTHPYMWMLDDYGVPVESSWFPDMALRYEEEEDMTLIQRMVNAIQPVRWHLHRHYSYLPRIDKILREKLGLRDMPPIGEYQKNVSLVMTNSHFVEEYGRSQPPLIVPVGGMHCFNNMAPSLPKDLEKFMNETRPAGFIYVSFGSAARLSRLPPDIRSVFFTAMKNNSNVKFLLKWDGEIPKDMPENAFTASWLPQQNVLEHPNIRGFITHGGLLGIQEAMCSGVPLIVMPIFGEQDYNANRIHRRRRGLRLDLYGITSEKLSSAISGILTDQSYKNNMEEASSLFLDRQEPPVDTAVWWTEYTLRRGRVEYLKPRGIYQTWYQRRLLDVWALLFGLLIVSGFLVWKVLQAVSCFCYGNRLSSQEKQKLN